MLEGRLLGEGGARKAAGCGLGTRFLAGEKCCCRAEKGFFSWGSATDGREVASSRVGGRSTGGAPEKVEVDFARVWPETRGAVEIELADGLRRCREVVSGGLDRSCFGGSAPWLVFGCWVEEALCRPATG